MLKRVSSACTILFGLALLSCDALTVTTMGVGILTKTPDIAQSGIIDSRLITAVGELPIDQVVLATAFVGDRPSVQDQTPPTGIAGATVRLQFAGKSVDLKEVTVAEQVQGTYMALSADLSAETDDDAYVNTELEYLDNTEYAVYIDIAGDYYDLGITAPPAVPASDVAFSPALGQESITGISPALSIYTHARNAALNVSWTTDVPRQAFITLGRVEYTGAADMSQILQANAWQAAGTNPLFDSFPRTPEAFLKLVTDTPVTSVDLEASLFSEPGLYVMLLTVVEINTDNQMSLGSAGIGGVATPFAFIVKP